MCDSPVLGARRSPAPALRLRTPKLAAAPRRITPHRPMSSLSRHQRSGPAARRRGRRARTAARVHRMAALRVARPRPRRREANSVTGQEASSHHDGRQQLSGIVRLGIASAVLASLLMATPTASGAVYEVHACRLPNGAPAPANGWSVTTGAIATVNCPGGVITVRTPSGTMSPGWRYGVEFVAPEGTNIVSYDRRVEGNLVQVAGGPPPWSWDYLEG